MFLMRQAGPADFDNVFPLARALDSYNLPADRGYIRKLLAISEASFQGKLPIQKAKYLFVLEEIKTVSDTEGVRHQKPRVVGCSLIIAQHGTPGWPHLWLALDTVTKYSRTLRIRRSHRVLRLGFTEDGPTEVGGLVVLPRYRRRPEGCGWQISYVRFLYMAMHPERFEKKVLVEYRGALGAGNKSTFWEAIGRVFTGLSYEKADRLSVANKEFILKLLPHEPIYCALLPRNVQAAIGAVHPQAARAARLLQGIGFRPIPQIEPFDGGPYYAANLRQIRIVQRTQRLTITGDCPHGVPGRAVPLYLVGTDSGGSFRALLTPSVRIEGRLRTGNLEAQLLGVQEGDSVYACPISR